ncbi:hypothetical protein [Halopseudomonas maritima]|uniref:hypothetical protein n=1 Tax=Halopseudomonas maritima TaxID=2918528 RepID=UPI001EEA5A02|nr:hypothetical protein [Halopseudomonas maritima]UJJ31994.1 hypothetical protein HV822_02160 [Halopseudomonas maritima]
MSEQEKNEILKLQIGIWEKVIDVQMHFNDLCLKIRSFAVSILGVLLGAAAIAYRFAGFIEFSCYRLPTATIFIAISIIAWLAFYMMDRYWYHELLKGAVHHAQKIEDSLKGALPEIQLSHSIREQSHKSLKMNAAKKLHIFYLSILVVQIAALLALVSGVLRMPS